MVWNLGIIKQRKGIELPRNELIMIILVVLVLIFLFMAYYRIGSGINEMDLKNVPGVSGFLEVAGSG